MKKSICSTVIFALLIVCLSSCAGYNRIMRDHLSEPENYHTFEAVLQDMYYRDPDTNDIVRDFEGSGFLDHEITLCVSFDTVEDLSAFLGGRVPNSDIPLEDQEIELLITSENNNALYSNGFYDNVSLGDKISIRTTNWIYMDGDFFFIAQLKHNDREYLSFEEGLKNIIDMMDKNKSLL